MNKENSFIKEQKLKRAKLKLEYKHPFIVRNLKITGNISKILATTLVCTSLVGHISSISHMNPFDDVKVKVPEYKQIVYDGESLLETDHFYEISNSEYIKVFEYSTITENNTQYQKITVYTLDKTINYKYIIDCIQHNFSIKEILKDSKDTREYIELNPENKETRYKVIAYDETGKVVYRDQTNEEIILKTIIFLALTFIFNYAGMSLIKVDKVMNKIKDLFKEKNSMTKEEVLEQLEIINGNLEIMEGHHER